MAYEPVDVLVTGADGFVGSALVRTLEAARLSVRRAVRRDRGGGVHAVPVGDVDGDTDWRAALTDVRCVVHLVARTHVLHESVRDPLAEYVRINVDGTRRLAQEAAAAGVRRLVFMSSVKVNGESTLARPYTEDDAPRPEDAYGLSKLQAEEALARAAAGTRLETVVLRPPLVYGPGVKGNFLRLLGWIDKGIPLPFASLDNRRSLVHVGNLCSAVHAAISAPQAAGRTFLVSDGEDVSTPDLVREIARALAMAPRLLPCPPALLRGVAAALGRSAETARLTGSLQVDASRIRRELAWQPPYTMAQAMVETARWYREAVSRDP